MSLLKTQAPPWSRQTEDVVVALEGFDAVLELLAPEGNCIKIGLPGKLIL